MRASWIYLESAVCLSVSGKDARRYLHNRLTNDIRSLTKGQSIQAAALTPQGRVEGLFTVLCEADDSFLLCSDGGDGASLGKIVGRFIVADRVSVSDATSTRSVVHIAGDVPSLQAAVASLDFGRMVVMPVRRFGEGGIDVVIDRGSLDSFFSWSEAQFGRCISTDEYYCSRWRAGVPVFPLEINEEAILTECGMRHAVSFNKGCYVGQEVIERSDAIGKLPRALERIEFSEVRDFAPGSPVSRCDGSVVGKLLSCGIDREHQRVLAFALCRAGTVKSGDAVVCNAVGGDTVPGAVR